MISQLTKKWLGIVVITTLLSACQSDADNDTSAAKQSPQPPTVDVITLITQPVTLTNSLPARTVAYRKAEVRPQVNGIIDKRLFEEGAQVEAGQQLYQIEPALYEAALADAQAELARARAGLQTAKAREARYKNLMDDKAISRQEYDDALATYRQAQAEIQVQQAAVKSAKTNLNYTRVNAPISGRIGKSNVTEGALVTAQQAEIMTTIHQLDPIYIDIAQPSRDLLQLRKQLIENKLQRKTAPKVTLMLEDGSTYPLTGELQFAEVNVQQSTGNVVLRAIMPNPDHLLLPGMFVRAKIVEGELENAILAPQRGVSFDREGHATAMVVNQENKVEARQLKVKRAITDSWLIESGLEADDRLVVAGLQKISPGISVNIDQNHRQTPQVQE
ncbi:efflux RND transporter periplasmic adaptor subunit [Methylophaga sp. OBS4]|uniref:efflux RND transporter periplasmic adaptor subunit n=1 Tax=Methylophaga sp. OBS4 TaxID=2991935 RepID=UPI0022536167|nr:efflux RND transporter periplasmic adaptor subunit [Methylophaga sp. OBS4]MCX4188000.1 efflux RND transporter periplasmic adaptor subunit [Methylophaga sp. OBS4]